MSCPLFKPRHFPHSHYFNRTPEVAAVGTIFNLVSYDAVLGGIQTYHLPDKERLP